MCVKKCPETQWNAKDYIDGTKPFDLNVKNNLICINDDIKNGIVGLAQLKNAIKSNQCAAWYTASTPCEFSLFIIFCVKFNFIKNTYFLKLLYCQNCLFFF